MNAFPETDNEALRAYVTAIRARSRALKHKFAGFECERVIDERADQSHERIELRLSSTLRRDALRMSLWLWDDRWCWFDVRKGAKRGWQFEWSYDGRIAPAHAGGALVSALERSHGFAWGDAPDLDALASLWSGLLLRGPSRTRLYQQ